jgi:FKBP-type peptidyl-prolyl cis-trans isomerase
LNLRCRQFALVAALFSAAAFAADGGTALSAEEKQLLYALGALQGHKLLGAHLKANELQWVQRGFADAALDKKLDLEDPDLDEWGPRVDAFVSTRNNPVLMSEKARGKKALDQAARESGAARSASGVVVRILKEGQGAQPTAASQVQVNYEGRLIDGTVFDSSAQHGGPATFPLSKVIRCWTEGVQKLRAGGKAKLTCPSDLAYGDAGRPPQIPGGATLVFEIELLGVQPEGRP